MPNHCSNSLEFKNIEKHDKIFGDIIKLIQENDINMVAVDNYLDLFNLLRPMPNELINTISPNPINNKPEIFNKMDMILAEKNGDNLNPIYANNSTKEQQAALVEKFGESNWNDWRRANWGTKWAAYDVFVSYFDGECYNLCVSHSKKTKVLKFEFTTAWCPPVVLYDFLVENTEYEFLALYFEPNDAYAGSYSSSLGDNCFDIDNYKNLPSTIINEFNLHDFYADEEEVV